MTAPQVQESPAMASATYARNIRDLQPLIVSRAERLQQAKDAAWPWAAGAVWQLWNRRAGRSWRRRGGTRGRLEHHLFMYGLCAKFVPAAAPADVVVLSEDGEVFTPGESVA